MKASHQGLAYLHCLEGRLFGWLIVMGRRKRQLVGDCWSWIAGFWVTMIWLQSGELTGGN